MGNMKNAWWVMGFERIIFRTFLGHYLIIMHKKRGTHSIRGFLLTHTSSYRIICCIVIMSPRHVVSLPLHVSATLFPLIISG